MSPIVFSIARDTIENLFGGLLEVENFNFKFLEQRFDEKKKHQSIFSNAYLITAHSFNPDYRPQDKHIQILLMLNDLRMRLKPLLAELQSSPAQDRSPGLFHATFLWRGLSFPGKSCSTQHMPETLFLILLTIFWLWDREHIGGWTLFSADIFPKRKRQPNAVRSDNCKQRDLPS